MTHPCSIIVGGGPAGCSAALALLKNKWSVTLHEQRTDWKGRVCGAFLSPEAVHHLSWLNLHQKAVNEGAIPVTECTVTSSNGVQSRVQVSYKNQTGFALPRNHFEDLLLNEVRLKGGHVLMGSRIRTMELECHLNIAADGRFSIGAEALRQKRSGWYGWNARFKLPSRSPGELSIHFYPKGYVGLLTFADGTSNVSGLVYRRNQGAVSWDHTLEDALRQQPFLQHYLRGAERLSDWKGVGPLPYLRKVRWPSTHLPVGDAAAVGDPFLGEGIGRALASGPLIHQCLTQMNGAFELEPFLTSYQKLWDNSYRGRFLFGSLTRNAIKSALLYRPVTRFLVGQQWMTQKITHTFHQGAAPIIGDKHNV